MDGQEKKYWAFISYSHQDKKWGDWLHKKLETYKIPKALIASAGREGIVPKRIYPIFRDREELPSAADLGENINQALRQSRYLIVICSPRSAKSLWVNEEIKTFKALGNNNKVLCLIVDGEPNVSDKPELKLEECFSEAIKYKVSPKGEITTERVEPIAADARKGKDGKANALLKIIAGVLGVNYDALKQRDQARYVRKMQYFVVAALVLVGIFSFLSIGFYQAKTQAEQEKSIAKAETKKANHNVGLVFAEKAKAASKDHKDARAVLFSLAALNNLNPKKSQLTKIKIKNTLLKSVLIKQIFQSSIELAHNTIYSSAFSPDGNYFVSLGKTNKLYLYNVQTGEILRTFKKGRGKIIHVVFSPNGNVLATISKKRWICLIDIITGQELKCKRYTYSAYYVNGFEHFIGNAAFSPDGNVLAFGNGQLWNIKENSTLTIPSWRNNKLNTNFSFSPNGKILGSGDGSLWDAKTGEFLRNLEGYNYKGSNYVRRNEFAFVFSPDSKTLASVSIVRSIRDQDIKLWSVSTGKVLNVFKGHTKGVTSLSFSPNGKTLVSGSEDRTLRLWDVNANKILSVLEGHSQGVNRVAFTSDGKSLVSVSNDKTIRLWDLTPYQARTNIQWDKDNIRKVIISPNRELLASINRDGTIGLWDMATGKVIRVLKGHTKSIMDMAFSPNGKVLASGSKDNSIQLWDIKTGEKKGVLNGHTNTVNTVVFSPDGKSLASGSWDRTIRLWNQETSREILTIQSSKSGHSTQIIKFSPDGNSLASLGYDGDAFLGNGQTQIIDIWDVNSGKILKSLKGHKNEIRSIAFSPDGKTLVSATGGGIRGDISLRNTIRFWNIKTGGVVRNIKGEQDIFNGVVFSSSSEILASWSLFKVYLWEMKTGLLLHESKVDSLMKNVFFNDKTITYINENGSIQRKDIAPFQKDYDSAYQLEKLSQKWSMKLQNIEIIPISPKENSLYNSKPNWSKHHPFHWLPKAEKGDGNSMIELGNLYLRDNNITKAKHWFTQAQALSEFQPIAAERLRITKIIVEQAAVSKNE